MTSRPLRYSLSESIATGTQSQYVVGARYGILHMIRTVLSTTQHSPINSAASGHYFAACSPSPRPPSSPGTSFPVGSRGLAIVSSDRRGARGEQAALYSYTPGQVRSWARMLRREVRRNRFANLVEYGQLDLGGES